MNKNNATIEEYTINRFLSAQTVFGRFKLNLYVLWKRISWAVVISFTLFLKRLTDILFSSVALVALLPLCVVLAFCISLDGGTVFFRQIRIGLRGRPFQILKFRSMRSDAESRLKELLENNQMAQGVNFKMKNDPRITRLGKFLRKTSLDELPQLWNVFCGEMSLVGPRPPIPREVEKYSSLDRRRFMLKPGLTCLWQVGERNNGTFEVGNRNNIDFSEQVDLDVKYIENHNFCKDIWLLVKTVVVVFTGKGI